ncbi:MAG: VWA domain-containing protein, partial [Deltaproteobacteria bacterium]|nr:VWA domain-containing protein [Deltaproteobacteria bacterium]
DVEGWYWFTIPEGAAVERFALETNGQLIEGEMTERQQAAAAYEEAVQKAVDPALLEWVDGRTFRARIFPIARASERRVVLSYTQFLPLVDGVYRYVYPMGGEGEKPIQEFSLRVDLGDAGTRFEIATQQDARVSDDSRLVTMRRTGFLPRSDFMLELTPTEPLAPLRTYRYASGLNEADFVMLRYSPEVNFSALNEVVGDVVVVFDTSAGGGAMERQIRTAATEAVLRALSAGDRFAIVTADLQTRVLYPENGLAKVSDETVSAALERISQVSAAGASDLGDMFNVALKLVHGSTQPAVIYIGDGRPTVGEMSALALAGRLRRSLGDTNARLFTLAVGENANHPLMESISRVGGGQSYRIDTPEQIVQEALRFVGKVKTPTITDLKIEAGAGLDQRFSTATAKVTEGEEVIILARSHHALPKTIQVSGSLGGKPFSKTYETATLSGPDYGYIPSLWARMYLSRLQSDGQEGNRGTIVSLGLNYALMTPYTSFLVLESDEAYAAAGIERRQRQRAWMGFNTQSALVASASKYQGGAPVEGFEAASDDASAQWTEINEEAASEGPVPVMAEAPAVQLSEAVSGKRAAVSRPAKERAAPVAEASPERAKRPATARDSGATSGMKKSSAAYDGGGYVNVGVVNNARLHQFEKGICSDSSTRPLSQRRVLWSMALDKMSGVSEYATYFFAAGTSCELPSWEAQKQLLRLIAQRASSPQDISTLLYEFTGHPKYLSFLKRSILKRTFGPDAAMTLLQEG